jgi:hypothetical protein
VLHGAQNPITISSHKNEPQARGVRRQTPPQGLPATRKPQKRQRSWRFFMHARAEKQSGSHAVEVIVPKMEQKGSFWQIY